MNIKQHAIGDEVLGIVEQIKLLLAGHEPLVQSAILAELLGILLAGHLDPWRTRADERSTENHFIDSLQPCVGTHRSERQNDGNR
jgi:hypothetical protein